MNEGKEIQLVKDLGEQIGYGHLMILASALWRKSLKDKGYPEIGAFVPTCMPFIGDKEILEATERENEMYDKLIEKHS
jgi:hypothetical protein